MDAIATDHAPHRSIDKDVPFGEALPGISGLETALSLLLLAIEAGHLSLATAIRALVVGPRGILEDGWPGRRASSFEVGSVADLVVFDRGDRWTVTPEVLRSKGTNTPLLGRELPGRVLLTVAAAASRTWIRCSTEGARGTEGAASAPTAQPGLSSAPV